MLMATAKQEIPSTQLDSDGKAMTETLISNQLRWHDFLVKIQERNMLSKLTLDL